MISQDHLKVYDLTLTALSPVFVGSGKSYSKKEYIFLPPEITHSGAKVMLPDDGKFFHMLVGRNHVDQYESFILGPREDLYRFLTTDCRFSMNELRAISRYTISADDALDTDHSLKEIHAFTRNSEGCAYIPGSSLKGALRTVILSDILIKDNTVHRPYDMPIKKCEEFEGKFLNLLPLKKDKNGNTANDAVNSILRGIMISDSLPIDDSAIMLGGKIDAGTQGNTHSINLCRECIKPGTKIHFRLTLDKAVLKDRITINAIISAIRAFDSMYEELWQSHFAPPYTMAEIFPEDYILLGGGAGYFSKTLTYPYLGEVEGLKETTVILKKAFSKHRHENDEKLGISPRVDKYAKYAGELYPYGICGVSIQ